MQLIHTKVVDTSLLYPHHLGPPSKQALRVLARAHLKRSIQRGTGGHDAAEDARAALDLALLRLQRGPESAGSRGTSLMDALSAGGRRSSAVGCASSLAAARIASTAAAAVAVVSDEEAVLKGAKEASKPGVHFVCVELRGLQRCFEARGGGGEAALAAGRLDAAVGRLRAAAPPKSLFVVLTGQGNTVKVADLKAARKEGQGGEGAPQWTVGDEQELAAAVSGAASRLCFLREVK